MKPLIQRLSKDKEVNLQIIATAMHLEEKYGYTYRQIEEDGFDIAYKVPLHLYDTDRRTVSTAMAHLQLGLTKIFDKEDYDLVIILGDRYEMLPVVNVALIYNVPVCHLHGGETSLGNFDEYIRHAITKMSHLHLVSTEDFRQRVIQMGEQPQFVINTGALGVENALSIPPLTKEAIEKQLGIALEESYFVVLYHPVTFEQGKSAGEQMKAVLSALSKFGVQCLFIGSNSDTGSDDIAKAINTYLTNHENSHCFASLSTQLYHSLIRHSLGLIGNSSSGLIEVPSLLKPTLNIGDRQKGRLYGESVVSVPVETSSVLEGLSKLNEVTNFDNPYYKENASSIAYEAIKLYLKDEPSISQPFYDLKENNLK